MKKPSTELRDRQIRLALLRDWQRARHRKKPAGRRGRSVVVAPDAIQAPRRVNLFAGHAPAVKQFIDTVARKVLVDGVRAVLNFRETEAFDLSATILLYAEIDRIVTLSQLSKPITLIDPRRRRPREVMKQIGLHDVTRDHCDTVPSRADVVYWKASKGLDQSGESIGMLEVVAQRVQEEYEGKLMLAGLWRGVSEAVSNSVEHAYKYPRKDGFQGLPGTRWWMFTQVKDGHFFVAICDLGCGYRATIGETVPERLLSQLSATFIGSNMDASAIHTAMEYGRSGTSEQHRGKGSRDAISLLEKHRTGQLVIMSNTGWVRYEYREGQEHSRDNGSIETNIRGTILYWKLPLSGEPTNEIR